MHEINSPKLLFDNIFVHYAENNDLFERALYALIGTSFLRLKDIPKLTSKLDTASRRCLIENYNRLCYPRLPAKDYEEQVTMMDFALVLACEVNPPEIVMDKIIAIVCAENGNIDGAGAIFRHVLEKQETKSLDAAMTYSDIAWTHYLQELYVSALYCENQAFAIRKEKMDESYLLFADQYHSLGCIHEAKQDFHKATICYAKSLEILELNFVSNNVIQDTSSKYYKYKSAYARYTFNRNPKAANRHSFAFTPIQPSLAVEKTRPEYLNWIKQRLLETEWHDAKEIYYHLLTLPEWLNDPQFLEDRQKNDDQVIGVPPKCVLRDRFLVIEPPIKSFDEGRQFKGSGFLVEAGKYNGFSRTHKDSDNYYEITVDAAAKGILNEGLSLGKEQEARKLAQELQSLKDGGKFVMLQMSVQLFTKSSFLDKLVNKTLLEGDDSKMKTLGRYCHLLDRYFAEIDDQAKLYDIMVYGGANLNLALLRTYIDAIGTLSKKWLGFSSASKNAKLAELFGNTLFIIRMHRTYGEGINKVADISKISNFPEEEEVLFTAGIEFIIEKVEIHCTGKKFRIYLTVYV
ncbi:unnamed protein product [Didymodactylos carnosus]|uniref:NAD(P)(+)--arginine ADP-ribosyltransferase n=1 Tax=Didymodactylos carnosus TaxID=1234261 RepID=A0A814S3U0_9BILA|nr:unnamed protein product [Didymodactylos carnosus]CAF3906423.1 unnamed protein product [Didymodactylos carnosus]